MLASRRLPAPLMSRACRAGENPCFEGNGRGGSKKFCPGAGFQKVVGRCTPNWWIGECFSPKLLIVERYCLTNWPFSSTKTAFSSTSCANSSTSLFFDFRPLSSSFSFVYKEKREKRASTKEGRRSTNSKRCLFFNPPLVLRVSRNWWIVVD